jgi:YVTN family beta-propeller protein
MTLLLLAACGAPPDAVPATDLTNRAYVVSHDSDELFVFDHGTLEAVGSVDTNVVPGRVNGNHMALVPPDGSKVYVSASDANSLVVFDAATLGRIATIPVGAHNTHTAFHAESGALWVMNEDDNSISIVDTATDTVVHTFTDASFATPHFAQFSGDYAYVPNIAGNQISVVDLATYAVVDTLVPEGLAAGACSADPCGFADAQIGPDGVLFASHIETGRVVVYDTVSRTRLPDVEVGPLPWSAFVDPFADEGAAFVPSWGTETVTRVDAAGDAKIWTAGDAEVYGVNFSPTAPDAAFVLNRVRNEVAVIDRVTGERLETLAVGGTTETATTTPSGRLLLPVSSTGEVAVIDTATREELARFSGVGAYPWSVATANGQNYCH